MDAVTTTTPVTGTAFDDVGTGEPALVCLPGWCGNRDVFDPLAPRLAAARRTVVVDLPGHGESAVPAGDHGTEEVVEGVLEIIEHLRLARVVPVALSHAGWVAIELRRRLGPDRIPGLVLLDWMVLGTPPGFGDALAGLQHPQAWEGVRAGLFARWTEGIDEPGLHHYVSDMGAYGADQWRRAGREIARSFTTHGTPLSLLESLPDPCPTLHLYAQPDEDGVLTAQQAYAAAHPWFAVQRLPARSHFPMFEVPEEMAGAIERFTGALR